MYSSIEASISVYIPLSSLKQHHNLTWSNQKRVIETTWCRCYVRKFVLQWVINTRGLSIIHVTDFMFTIAWANVLQYRSFYECTPLLRSLKSLHKLKFDQTRKGLLKLHNANVAVPVRLQWLTEHFSSPYDAEIVKVPSSSLSAEGLFEGQHHTGHTVPVPDRPKDTVPKPATQIPLYVYHLLISISKDSRLWRGAFILQYLVCDCST